jgi:hypothetical protein
MSAWRYGEMLVNGPDVEVEVAVDRRLVEDQRRVFDSEVRA